MTRHFVAPWKSLARTGSAFLRINPFERMQDAANWFDNTDVITDEERLQIGRKNAIELFKLDMD